MAKNLQAKLPPTDSIRIYDINKAAAEKLAGEMRASASGGAAVEIADSVNHAARDAVSGKRGGGPRGPPAHHPWPFVCLETRQSVAVFPTAISPGANS